MNFKKPFLSIITACLALTAFAQSDNKRSATMIPRSTINIEPSEEELAAFTGDDCNSSTKRGTFQVICNEGEENEIANILSWIDLGDDVEIVRDDLIVDRSRETLRWEKYCAELDEQYASCASLEFREVNGITMLYSATNFKEDNLSNLQIEFLDDTRLVSLRVLGSSDDVDLFEQNAYAILDIYFAYHE